MGLIAKTKPAHEGYIMVWKLLFDCIGNTFSIHAWSEILMENLIVADGTARLISYDIRMTSRGRPSVWNHQRVESLFSSLRSLRTKKLLMIR